MTKFSFSSIVPPVAIALALAACSPTYNWRDYNSPDAPYRVMFPAKPASYTRTVDLGNIKVNMTMTAAEVEDTIFAVGTAEAPDPQQAQAALASMEEALVHNINGKVSSKKSSASATATAGSSTQRASDDVEASGVLNGKPMRLIGHFESRDKRIYQVIVMGPSKSVKPEETDQFLTSFKLL